MELREALREYIAEELLDDDAPVADDDNLLADGMVSSLGMLRLVGFIEASWGVTVPPEDFTIEHFRTVAALDSYLTARLAGGTGQGADG